MHIFEFVICNPDNRIIHVAQNCGSGYTSKVFDCNVGYTSNFIMNGNFIFVAKYKVSFIIIVHMCIPTYFIIMCLDVEKPF